MVDKAIEKLSDNLQDELARAQFEPMNLNELIDWATAFDNRLRARSADRSNFKPDPSKVHQPKARSLPHSLPRASSPDLATPSVQSSSSTPTNFSSSPSRPRIHQVRRQGESPEEEEWEASVWAGKDTEGAAGASASDSQ